MMMERGPGGGRSHVSTHYEPAVVFVPESVQSKVNEVPNGGGTGGEVGSLPRY